MTSFHSKSKGKLKTFFKDGFRKAQQPIQFGCEAQHRKEAGFIQTTPLSHHLLVDRLSPKIAFRGANFYSVVFCVRVDWAFDSPPL